MAENKSSQTHNDTWNDAAEQHLSRVATFVQALERLEGDHLERTRTALDEMTRLAKEGLDYSNKLTAEWRRMTMEGARRSVSLMQLGTQ